MNVATKSRRTTKKPIQTTSKTSPASDPFPVPRPGGKLGLIVDRLSTKSGATADELVKATGWQRHSVLGALSKLKSRGFEFQLDAYVGRKAYRLTKLKG